MKKSDETVKVLLLFTETNTVAVATFLSFPFLLSFPSFSHYFSLLPFLSLPSPPLLPSILRGFYRDNTDTNSAFMEFTD